MQTQGSRREERVPMWKECGKQVAEYQLRFWLGYCNKETKNTT